MSTDQVKLSARLPVGERNGLDALALELGDDPSGSYIVIALVDPLQILKKVDTGETTATLRIRRIEAPTGMYSKQARELLLRAVQRRTGRDQLTLDDLLNDDDPGGTDQ